MFKYFIRGLFGTLNTASLHRRIQNYQIQRVKRRHQKKIEKHRQASHS